MDREKLHQVVTNAISTGDARGPADPDDYDIDAIIDELAAAAPEGPVQELDNPEYWATIEKHKKNT